MFKKKSRLNVQKGSLTRSALHLPDWAPCCTYLSSRTSLSGPKGPTAAARLKTHNSQDWPVRVQNPSAWGQNGEGGGFLFIYLCVCHSAQFFPTIPLIKLQDSQADLLTAGWKTRKFFFFFLLHSLISKANFVLCVFFSPLFIRSFVCLMGAKKDIF